MERYICATCGTQYSLSNDQPESCKICEDQRQYVSSSGQKWTTLEEMQRSQKFTNEIEYKEEGIYGITTKPKFAIGQTAYLIQSKGFNILWDCITYLDEETIEKIKQSGGIDAIALSHPHYYSTQVEWAETFDAPIYIHENDRKWVTRLSDRIRFWSGDSLELSEEITLHCIGGHFKGGTILHWKNNNDGVLFTGDIIQIVADQPWVSFMYSYPNLIPLPAEKVQSMAEYTNKLSFHRLYNAFDKVIKENAHESVQKSAKRYIKALRGELFDS
ncbi:MBL fold metallo-hydrolase [Tetragenococcus halophilus]